MLDYSASSAGATCSYTATASPLVFQSADGDVIRLARLTEVQRAHRGVASAEWAEYFASRTQTGRRWER